MRTIIRVASRAALINLLLSSTAMAASDSDITALKAELKNMKATYEGRIAQLENKLAKMERTQEKAMAKPQVQSAAEVQPAKPSSGGMFDNRFNPSIGVILNGRYSAFSEKNSSLAGFGIGEEGERGKEGLAVDESELNFSANVDDKFTGSLTAALVREGGEDKIELEEAYVQTAGGALPWGLSAKAGRFLATLGYLNEHHTHADDFADRPLPYRAFLNNAFNDDGAEISLVLPTDFYSEVGGGVFRGDDFPFGDSGGSSVGAWSAFARVGGDIGEDQNWRLGASMLSGEARLRESSEGDVTFSGDSKVYIADARYTWAPTGNPREQEVLLQGEHFWRSENGDYEDTPAATGLVPFDGTSSGWYAQATYKFRPQWRVGARYSRLDSPDLPSGLIGSSLDGGGYDPTAYALMADWTNSEFSRVRLQYNREELSRGQGDNQILLQYIMSLGAHGAHKY